MDLPDKPAVSHQCISKQIDGMFYTLKDVRAAPVQWNTPQVKEERNVFANWMMGDGLHTHKVFLDEFGCNVWTARTKGRSICGDRAVRVVEGQRGQNVTICLAVSPILGVVHYSIFAGGMTKERFSDFLVELGELMAIVNGNYVVLCDNARPHMDAPGFGNQQQGYLRHLPTNSPFLNACEMAGSCLKAAVKRSLSEPHIQAEIYNRTSPGNLQQRRIRVVSRELENCLPVVTIQKCNSFVTHVMKYIPACIRRDDIYD